MKTRKATATTKLKKATMAALARKARKAVTPPASVPARQANAQVYQSQLAGPHDPAAVPTVDPADRAHQVRDERGFLVPAAIGKRPTRMKPNVCTEHATPRVYHRSQVNTSGLAVDSQFDELWEAQRRLEGIPGIGCDSACTSAMQVSAAVRRLTPRQFDQIARGRQHHAPELGE